MIPMRLLLILSVLCCFANPGMANASSGSKTDLLKRWPKADAVIRLYHTTIEFYIDPTTQAPRVKQSDVLEMVPLSNAGLERMYTYNSHSYLANATMKLEGRKRERMVKTCGDWQSDAIFHSDQQFCHYQSYSNKEADYYLFTAEKHYKDLRYFAKTFFNDPVYPIEQLRYEVIIPDWLELDIKSYQFDYFNVTRSEENLEAGRKICFEASNLKAMEEDDSFLSAEHAYPHLLFLAKSYTNQQQEKQSVIENLDDLYHWYQTLVGDLPTDTALLQPVVDDILTSAGSRTDSIKSIYYWVQDHIRYLAFEDGLAGFRPDPAHKVYNNKYGDCKGMSSLLKSMLGLAGFEAQLAWMGTRHLIYDYSTPCLAVDNHMICYLEDKGQSYFLDATQSMMPLGVNGVNLQGKQVLINNGDSYLLKTIPVAEATADLVKTQSTLQLSGATLEGHVALSYQGNTRSSLVGTLANIKSTDREDFIQKVVLDDAKYVIDSLQYADFRNREADFQIDFYTRMDGLVTTFNNEFYVNLDFWAPNDKFTKDTTAIYHLDLGRKLCSQVDVTLQLPDELHLVYLPEAQHYHDGPFAFAVSYEQRDGHLVYRRTMNVDTSLIEKAQFKAFFAFMNQYHKARSQTFELVRKPLE